MSLSGGCRCGATSYRLSLDVNPAIYVCHCLDCQTWSGSAFSEQALVDESAFCAEGPFVFFEFEGPSGFPSRHAICGTCHTRIYNRTARRPGLIVLRAGTLHDSHVLVPKAHIWVSRRQPWVRIPDECTVWSESPPPENFAAALRAGSARQAPQTEDGAVSSGVVSGRTGLIR